MTDEQMAIVGKALAHPTRIRLIKLLAIQTQCRGQEAFGELGIAQSTLSEHLSILKGAGLLSSRPVGTTRVYCLDSEIFEAYKQALAEIPFSTACCDNE